MTASSLFNEVVTCKVCKSPMHESTETREFRPWKKRVTVSLLVMICDHCGAQRATATQHATNLERLAGRRPAYAGMPMGEDYVKFRLRYGLTQKAACALFGLGRVSFSRYENEASYPATAARHLLRLAMRHTYVVAALAEMCGGTVPLLKERQEDEAHALAVYEKRKKSLPAAA